MKFTALTHITFQALFRKPQSIPPVQRNRRNTHNESRLCREIENQQLELNLAG